MLISKLVYIISSIQVRLCLSKDTLFVRVLKMESSLAIKEHFTQNREIVLACESVLIKLQNRCQTTHEN